MKNRIVQQGFKTVVIATIVMLVATQVSAQVTISSKKDVTCHGAKDGSASASVQGGTPPYTYLWTPTGGTGPTASGLSGGDYKIEVTDANDCKASANVTIAEPPALNVSVSGDGASVEYCSNQSPPSLTLSVSAAGGEPPYTYSWPGGSITVNSSGTYTATATDSKGCSKTGSATVVFIPVLCSQDPNDISGPEGYDTLHWIPKEMVMPFVIRFENDPEFATAPAQKVTINQKVDPNMNIFSFRLSDFGFGDFTFNVPPNTTFYSQRLDVRDSLGIYVDVLAGINIINNELFWIFESIDPNTGQAPIDATIGMLPVNDSITKRGEGFVTYSILPKTSVTSGDTINAKAVIVFDVNEAIETNEWQNTIDAIAPTSKVVDNFTTYSDTTSITINFQGSDDPNGTGIKSYKLYYSKNNGPFTLYQEFSADTIATFNTTSGYYQFYSIATDHVGNQEAAKNKADAEIIIISNLKYAIDGTLNYANFNTTPLPGSQVYLKTPGGTILDTFVSGIAGEFQIENLSTGMYVIDAASTLPWGGVNATDALMINRAAVQMVPFDSLQQKAADVNASNTITATDALLALRRSIGLDSYFDAGDWFFHPDTVMIKGDSIEGYKLFGLCYGDVNRSFQPSGAKMFRSVTPEYVGTVEIFDQEFTYPLTLLTPAMAGAISLTLTYPADQIEITGITFKGKELLYNDLGGVIRIGWQQIQGEAFKADEVLLGINMKKLPVLIAQSTIQPRLVEHAEIADVLGDVLYGTRLQMPEVVFRTSLPDQFALISNYPNPCSKTTMFHFQTPEAGIGEIRIFNMLGELAEIIQLGDLEAGEYQRQIDVSKFASGVYHYTLHITGSTQNYSAAGRLIIGIKP